jgi:hypothetical protein
MENNEMGGACSSDVERRDMYRILVGKHEGGTTGETRRRWEDNIKRDLLEVGGRGMDWSELAQVAGSCECGNEPSVYTKYGKFPD